MLRLFWTERAVLSHPEQQRAFRAALTSQDVPLGVTAVGDLSRRFSVYRNTVAHSLSMALAQRFPAIQRLVGPDFFAAMAKVFVDAHPPRTPLLHEYGAEFPDFLAQFPPVATLPYLPDVARIEVLRGQAYHAADKPPMKPEAFTEAISTNPDRARLALHPSLRTIASAHPAVSIWRMNQPGLTPSAARQDAEAALIFRHKADVLTLPTSVAIALAAAQVARGLPLGEIGQTVAADMSAPDFVADLLTTLLRNGLVVGVSPPQT